MTAPPADAVSRTTAVAPGANAGAVAKVAPIAESVAEPPRHQGNSKLWIAGCTGPAAQTTSSAPGDIDHVRAATGTAGDVVRRCTAPGAAIVDGLTIAGRAAVQGAGSGVRQTVTAYGSPCAPTAILS